jgi:hypothetical protein
MRPSSSCLPATERWIYPEWRVEDLRRSKRGAVSYLDFPVHELSTQAGAGQFSGIDFCVPCAPNFNGGEHDETCDGCSQQVSVGFHSERSRTVPAFGIPGPTHCGCFSCVSCSPGVAIELRCFLSPPFKIRHCHGRTAKRQPFEAQDKLGPDRSRGKPPHSTWALGTPATHASISLRAKDGEDSRGPSRARASGIRAGLRRLN